MTATAPRIDDATVAEATYKAMCAVPAFAKLAHSLESATRPKRAKLLDAADPALHAPALAYLAQPEAVRERNRRLAWMREDPRRAAALKIYYAQHIASFIDDWGQTLDPRLLARGGEAIIPFRLFPAQRKMIEFMLERYRNDEVGTVTKARDCGASWCAMSMLASLCLFTPNFTAIVASALEVKLDESGTTGSLFHKLRMFLEYIPVEFRGGWTIEKHSAFKRIWFPNGSAIQGQAGDQIGRGERAACVIIDEAAWLEHADAIDASLAATSECKIYISSVNGPDNSFAVRARNEAVPQFIYTWRDDPRKNEAWKARKIAADGLRKFGQEYDCDFFAGTQGQMLLRPHLDAAIDADIRLGIHIKGRKFAAFDPGNGGDPSALAVAHGNKVIHAEEWPSSNNLFKELRRAVTLLDKFGVTEFCADMVGVGAGIVGDMQQINAERAKQGRPRITLQSFKGSESPLFGNRASVPGSSYKAEDTYMNRKAQGYAWIQYGIALTFQAINGDVPKNVDNMIFFCSKIPQLNKMLQQFGQITAEDTTSGKLKINKYGDGFSPNIADAVMMCLAPRQMAMNISAEALANISARLAGMQG